MYWRYTYKPQDVSTIEVAAFEIELAKLSTRRRFLIGSGGLIGAAALGACNTGQEVETPIATTTATRTITDPTERRVEVPTNPQRIVVLDPGTTIFMLVDLGIVPIGATTDITTVGGNFPTLLGDVRTKIKPVGDSLAPNLELIAAQQPDLIFYHQDFSDPSLDNLSALAPTVQFTNASFGKDPAFYARFVADAVNRQAQGEALIQQWETSLNETAAKINVRGQTCAIVLLYAFEPNFELHGPESSIGHLAERLGWTIVPATVTGQPLETFSPPLSLEQIPTVMEADTVLFLRFANETTLGDVQAGSIIEDITTEPIWQAIPAVREGRVIELDAMMARGGYGYIGLEVTLDTIVQELTRSR
ncbi:MAG: ABC transporter substrate-binding protein [Chloroflexota bacterium]